MNKEIITKAVIDKAIRETDEKFYLDIEQEINFILGSWVTNHKYIYTKDENDSVKIKGTFNLNIWYSYENDSKTDVMIKKIEYLDFINVNKITSTSEIGVTCIKKPSVKDIVIGNGKTSVIINKEMKIEIIDEIRIKVKVDEDDEC